eukprot:SAG25_NODE_53_length_18703_cov_126.779104_11_plen_56_part_00
MATTVRVPSPPSLPRRDNAWCFVVQVLDYELSTAGELRGTRAAHTHDVWQQRGWF